MKARMIALLLSMCMCLSLLTGCGGAGSGSAAPAGEQSGAQSSESAQASAAESTAQAPESSGEGSAAASDAAEVSAPAQDVPPVEIDPNAPEVRVGMLTILNMEEEDAANFMMARKLATVQLVKEGALIQNGELNETNAKVSVTYYDTLDAMLMALNAGDLDTISVSEVVADYLLSTNDGLVKNFSCDEKAEHSKFAKAMEEGILGEGYSFMMMSSQHELRDEFDKALDEMKADGTLDRITKEQITDVLAGKDPVEIEIPPLEGADTINVAVTGSLPPMDYVSPLGMPVGFSTAVLAEISQRINKNISVSVVDAGARAAALSSAKADVVFWTRTSTVATEAEMMSEEERAAIISSLSEEEQTVVAQIDSIYNFPRIAYMDVPDGTIVTQPYFTGLNLPVSVK